MRMQDERIMPRSYHFFLDLIELLIDNFHMKLLICALFLYGCSQLPKPKNSDAAPIEDHLITAQVALDHIQFSYLRGCVDAFKLLKIPASFETCRDKSKEHRKEVFEILQGPPYELK